MLWLGYAAAIEYRPIFCVSNMTISLPTRTLGSLQGDRFLACLIRPGTNLSLCIHNNTLSGQPVQQHDDVKYLTPKFLKLKRGHVEADSNQIDRRNDPLYPLRHSPRAWIDRRRSTVGLSVYGQRR